MLRPLGCAEQPRPRVLATGTRPTLAVLRRLGLSPVAGACSFRLHSRVDYRPGAHCYRRPRPSGGLDDVRAPRQLRRDSRVHRFKPDGGPDEGPDWRPAPESMRRERGRTLRCRGDSAAVRSRALARLGHTRGRVPGTWSPLPQKVYGPCADSLALGHLANSCLPRTWRAHRLVDPPSLGRPVVLFPHVVLIANPCRNRLGGATFGGAAEAPPGWRAPRVSEPRAGRAGYSGGGSAVKAGGNLPMQAADWEPAWAVGPGVRPPPDSL